MARSAILTRISRRSLLDVVPGFSALVAERGQVRVVEAGTEVARQGQPIAFVIMPLTNGLRLVRRTEGEVEIVGYLQSHRVLGLRELLAGEPYPYAAMSEASTSFLSLNAEEFLALVRRTPEVERYLRLITSSSAVRQFKAFLDERGVSTGDVLKSIARIEEQPVVLDEGEALSQQGKLCFVEAGRVRVERRDGNVVRSSFVAAGGFFGGEALATGAWSYSVTAASDVRLLILDAPSWRMDAERLGVVDALFEEPWLFRRGDDDTQPPSVISSIELPAKTPSEAELEALGVRMDAGRLRYALDEREALVASLANALSMLGLDASLGNLEPELEGAGGVSMLRLAEICEPLGVVSRLVKTGAGVLTDLDLPALFFVGQRLCVLVKTSAERLLVHDPLRGFLLVERGAMVDATDSIFLELRREAGRASPTEPSSRPRLPEEVTGALRGGLAVLGQVFLFSALAALVGLLPPWLSQLAIDRALPLRDYPTFISCLFGMIVCTGLGLWFWRSEQDALALFGRVFSARVAVSLYRRALSLPAKFFAGYKAGDILVRLDEVSIIRNALSASTLKVALEGLRWLVLGCVLATYQPLLAAALVGGSILTMGAQIFMGGTVRRLHRRAFEARKRASSMVAEQVAGIASIKAGRAGGMMRQRWESAWLDALSATRATQGLLAGAEGVDSVGFVAARIAGLWLAARAVFSGQLSAGELLAVSMYLEQGLSSASLVGRFYGESQRLLTAVGNVGKVLDAAPEMAPEKVSTSLSIHLQGRIRLERVGFRYDERTDWAVRDVSCTIYPRQMIALVGRSGSGKTTLANLIAGMVPATTGRIFYDGFDSSFLSPGCLRRNIGYVMQTNELFQASIRQNIAYCDDAPSFDQVEVACDIADAHGFIASLPMGMSTHLGEGGMGLSGGQKQRIAIARTVYRDPRILILDEATSALDAEAEQAVAQRLYDLSRSRTTVVVAHRFSTIRRADVVLVMDEGQLVEVGSHEELMARGGFYTKLFEHQLIEAGE